MTKIISANNTALLILEHSSFSTASKTRDAQSVADKITAIVHGVSNQTSPVKTQASSAINSALLDMKETNDAIVSGALQLLDSGNFKSSEPGVADIIKKLISDDGDKFASLVKAERDKNPGIADDNAIANAIQSLIKSNRAQFGDGEFVIGFKLAGGGAIISNIEDVDGNSTRNALRKTQSDNSQAMAEARDAFLAAGQDTSKLTNSEGGRLSAATSAVLTSVDANYAWLMKWTTAFGF